MFRKSDEKSVWLSDFEKDSTIMIKDVFGSAFLVKDSCPDLHWKLTNENRVIAGYNCRKAVGKIMDSVYVFAFYTDEILIPGGPCTVNGLPGMILGMTIPRLYSSWIANKVSVRPVKPEELFIATSSKNSFNRKMATQTVIDKTKGWTENSDDPESRKWIDQLIWNLIL
jgi:GLPGLI family protein